MLFRKSFARKISMVILLVISITFLLTAIISNNFTKEAFYNNAVESGRRAIAADEASLSVYLQYLRRSSMELYYNTNIYTLLYSSHHTYQDSYALFSFLRSLMNLSSKDCVTQIYLNLYSSGQSYLISGAGREHSEASWAVNIPETAEKYQVYVEAPHTIHMYGKNLKYEEDLEVCSFHWNIYNATGDSILGTISFDIETDTLGGFLSSAENGTPVYLLDEQGEVIFKNVDLLSGEEIREIIHNQYHISPLDVKNTVFEGTAFIQKVEVDSLSWYILELNPYDLLYQGANSILRVEIEIMIIAGCICAVLSLAIIFKRTKPLRDLKDYVQVVERGDLSVHVSDYTTYQEPDEIGALVTHMEKMMGTVNEMFLRQQKLSRAHRSAEVKMLLNQVNPHFIYNTLQSISTLALVHKDKEVYQLLTSLGSQMQYSMSLDCESVELIQEIKHVESYLALQSLRFNHRFRYELHVDPAAEFIVVPRMLLQPLVENAFKHGRIHNISNGFVCLQILLKGEVLQIVVTDNGKGCKAEQLQAVNHSLNLASVDEIKINDHIGLLNVQYRLKLLYGNRVHMKLETSAWTGIIVTLCIPLNPYQ